MTTPPDDQGPSPAQAADLGFPFETPTYLFHLLVAIDRQRDLRLDERLRALGTNVAKYRAIGVIARIGPCGMSELADYSVVDRTTMTRTVDQLVAEGLADRTTPPVDRRRVVLTLTEAGRDLYARCVRVITQLNQEMVAGLTEAQQIEVARAEETMLRNLVVQPGLAERLMHFKREGGGA
jgi:DNA-binding MarR family transcriptional regulator